MIVVIDIDGTDPLKIAAKRDRVDQEYFKTKIEPLLAGADVEFIGEIGEHQKSEFLGNAAALVFPIAWREPFVLVMLEAIACGAPLITSPRGGLPEVAGDAAVYANPDSPEEIAAAMLALASNPARRQALSEAGRARSRQFDTPIAAARLAELRRAALNRSG